jgi:hypothetical protein
MDVDDFDRPTVWHLKGGLLIALGGVADFPLDFPAGDDAVGLVCAVVAATAVECVGDPPDLMGIGILEQNDVGIPGGEVGGGIAEAEDGAVHGDDTDDRGALVWCRRTGSGRGFSEIGEHPGLIRADEQGDRPASGHDQ